MEISPHESLEKEIQELSVNLKNKSIAEKRDAIKVSLAEKIGLNNSSSAQAPSVPVQSATTAHSSSILPPYATNLPEELQLEVEKLVDLAWHKGIDVAIASARQSGPMVLDMLHDSLTGKIYDEMEKRGLL